MMLAQRVDLSKAAGESYSKSNMKPNQRLKIKTYVGTCIASLHRRAQSLSDAAS
jgi:hypothetical protein